MVVYTDTINGFGLLIAGLAIPIFALMDIGDGNMMTGLTKVFNHAPEKFAVISNENSIGEGARDATLPFSVLFTGLIINQLYFWTMHQSIIQRALGAVSIKEAQKGLLYTGVLKILIPLVIVLPGVIGFYLVKKVLPVWMTGFFVAVMVGAILSTFNSALNSAATIWSLGIYKRYIAPSASESRTVWMGKMVSASLAIFAILIAPFVANAPDGLYQLLQELNGIFFIPMATVILAGFFFPKVSAMGAKAGLFFGLGFYVLMNFILKVDLHFVHIWGIEFVVNVGVMHLVSNMYPRTNTFKITNVGAVEMGQWKYAKLLSWILVGVTIWIYILLGTL